jgi:cold shock CspA family protein
MATGTGKWFNGLTKRRSGFKSLQEGQKVSFEVKQGPKGKQAASIKPL